MTLQEQLQQLPDTLRQRIEARGFSSELLLGWAGTLDEDIAKRNQLPGAVARMDEAALPQLPHADPERAAACSARGEQALRAGELAVCVLAGGMATRMGGVVKTLVEALPGRSFLDLRLAEREALRRSYGAAPPLFLMTSEPTHGPVTAAVAERAAGEEVACFEQCVSLRLSQQGELFRGADGELSVYATGHGDLPDALRDSGLLKRFVDGGGRHIWISNVDNLGACVDTQLLGHHILSEAAVTVELVDKDPGDRGGGPVLHDGRPIIAEHFRLPPDFDGDQVPVFNTNTFLVDARKLLDLDMRWTYVRVSKQVGDAKAVQFERLLGEITEGLPTSFVRVPRRGTASRFMPIKSREDLQKQQPLIEQLARARGWITQ